MVCKRKQSPDDREADAGAIATILAGKPAAEVEAAYRTLMRKYWRLVSTLVTAQIGDRREAEDIAQEAFLRAFRSLGKLKTHDAFLGWLLRIARNLGTDRMRRRKPTVSLEALGEMPDGAAATLWPDYLQRVETNEEIEHMMQAVARLPRKYREVIVLKYVQELDGRSMAQALGEPEGTVRNRLFRALERLRQTLEEKPRRPEQV